jgi:hypothetical protein
VKTISASILPSDGRKSNYLKPVNNEKQDEECGLPASRRKLARSKGFSRLEVAICVDNIKII